MDTELTEQLASDVNNVIMAATKPLKEQIECLRSQLVAKQLEIDALRHSFENYRTEKQGHYVR